MRRGAVGKRLAFITGRTRWAAGMHKGISTGRLSDAESPSRIIEAVA